MPTEDDYGFNSGYGTNYETNSDSDNNRESGYGSSGYGGLGYGNADGKGSPYSEVAGSDMAFGAGDTPYQTDLFQDGYRENIYEVNNFDNAYTESAANSNPRGRRYKPTSKDYGDDEQLVL